MVSAPGAEPREVAGWWCKTVIMIVAFSLVPSGGRASREDGGVADAVAAAVRVIRDSGPVSYTHLTLPTKA